jgi:hypothetical protein
MTAGRAGLKRLRRFSPEVLPDRIRIFGRSLTRSLWPSMRRTPKAG